jgi:hypothetical protein
MKIMKNKLFNMKFVIKGGYKESRSQNFMKSLPEPKQIVPAPQHWFFPPKHQGLIFHPPVKGR